MEVINNYEKYLEQSATTFIDAILNILDNEYTLYNKKERKDYTTSLLRYIADQMFEEDFENKLQLYPKIKSKKNLIFINLQSNIIDNNVKQLIGIYLNLNILILINQKYFFLNNYNNTYGTIILIINIEFIYINKIFNNLEITNLCENINEELLYKYIDDTDKTGSREKIAKILKKAKIPELKEYVKDYNLDSTKMTKLDLCKYITELF
jgi:hypothetical protein